jgi:hypothetical protein
MLIDMPDDAGAYFSEMVKRGWCDGLPVIPPTPERMEEMLAATHYLRDHSLGSFPPNESQATVELVAVNAVMAGCLPGHFPFVVAAVETVLAPDFNVNAVQTTTNAATPLVLVNGPVVEELAFNGGGNALGQGWRGNATVGRALRLCMVNIGGGAPGARDQSTLGQPGKYTLCLRENEERSPWEPFHVEKGFPAESTTVSVLTVACVQGVIDSVSSTAAGLLKTFTTSLAYAGMLNVQMGGGPAIILCLQHARIFADSGYTKHDLKQHIYEECTIDPDAIPPEMLHYYVRGRRPPHAWTADGRVSCADAPELIRVIVAGGEGAHSMVMPLNSFGNTANTRVVDTP